MPTNSLFYPVQATPPLQQIGWVVKVLDYRDFSTLVAVISQYSELVVGPELSDLSAGSITLDADSPFWKSNLLNGDPATNLLDYEYLWEAYEDGELRFQWLGTVVDESQIEEDETRTIKISGAGIGQTLAWACLLPPYFPPADDADHAGSYFWQFPVDWSAMRIWLYLLRVSQSRGTIPWIVPLFTETVDSGGAPWEVIQTPATVANPQDGIRPEMGTNLLDLLNIHTGQDATKQFAMHAEWFMWPGFRLDVRKTIGVHREDQVIFYETGLDQKERTRTREDISNYIVTIDANGATSFASDSTSISQWHQREYLENHNQNVTDPARRTAIGQVVLEQKKDEKSQWTIVVPYDQPGRRVFKDYNIGDWIGIGTYKPTGETVVDACRVLAITVTVKDDGLPTLELTLQSKFDQKQIDLQRQLTTILNAIGVGGDASLPTPTQYTASPPSDGLSLNWSPTSGYYTTPLGGGGIPGIAGPDGSYTGMRIFIQPDDPGDAANVGDLWIQTIVS